MRTLPIRTVLILALIALVAAIPLGCTSSPATPAPAATTAPAAPAATTAPAAPAATTAPAAPAATTAPSGAAPDKVFNLTYQGKWIGLEKQGWANTQMKLADIVKEKSNGRIIIKNATSEVVSDANVLDGVRTRVVDIGAQGLHSRGELALQNFISLPFVTYDKVFDALQETKPITLPEWEKLGVVGLGYNLFLPQFIFTKAPCDSFDTLKSMKLRVTGTIITDMLQKAGGHPLTMQNAEVYQAIQRGTIDGAQTALGGYIGDGLYEVAKYISAWPVGNNGLGVIMNKDAWNELGPELQKILMESVAEMEKLQYEAALADIEGLEKSAVEKGSIRQDPSKAEVDKLLEYVKPAVDQWKTKAGEAKANEVLTVLNKIYGTNY